MRLLNVGGSSKSIPIPVIYDGWDHCLLDIDPKDDVDVVCDAREMDRRVSKGVYDSIYCSHNLEHFNRHDIPKVLAGFKHALKDDGFIHIRVPNLQWVFEALVNNNLDVDTIMYKSPSGPISALDMIYGCAWLIQKSGQEFMCHRTGFTPASLGNTLYRCGWENSFVGFDKAELFAFAFKQKPTEKQMADLKLSYSKEIQNEAI